MITSVVKVDFEIAAVYMGQDTDLILSHGPGPRFGPGTLDPDPTKNYFGPGSKTRTRTRNFGPGPDEKIFWTRIQPGPRPRPEILNRFLFMDPPSDCNFFRISKQLFWYCTRVVRNKRRDAFRNVFIVVCQARFASKFRYQIL